MHSEAVFESLVDAGIVVADDPETLRFDQEFQDGVDELRDAVRAADEDERKTLLGERVDDETVRTTLVDLAESDPSFVACFLAVRDRVTAVAPSELLRVTAVLQQFRSGPPPSAGAPEAFLPVACDQLETVLQLSRKAVVYVWEEDCRPCELVAESFEELFEEPPEDLALLSVYGPDCAEFLHREYDVSIAPTTLFMIDGDVDARLLGAHYTEVYAHEVDVLRER